jgi:hypothetical protein
VRARRLEAAAGLRWIAGAFAIFRASPLRQLAHGLLLLGVLTFVMLLPVVGFALVWLLLPALIVGPHAIARAAALGAPPVRGLFWSGFRSNFPAQLRLGGLCLAGMLAVLAATVPADGGRFAQAMIGTAPLELADLQRPELQSAMLVGSGLQTLLLGLLWYAPLLVAWQGLAALKAAFFSAAAAIINWRALLAFGLGMLLLFALVLMLALAGAVLFGGGRLAQANAAMFAVVWTLLPVWFASSWLSYRDVFESPPGDGAVPPNSPTIGA